MASDMLTDMGAMRLASIFLLNTLPLMGATRLASGKDAAIIW